MNRAAHRLNLWAMAVMLPGALLFGPVAQGGEPSTNAPTRWPPLSELLKRWGDVPIDQVQHEAASGELTAQHYLGYCYSEGLRVPVDGGKAVEWYERAGIGGYLPSFGNLGLLYQRGKVVPRDYQRMLHFLRLGAEGGAPGAQINLGLAYRNGDGVQADSVEAMKWFRRAADQGDTTAFCLLGRFYRFGQGVPKDLGKAKEWFQKAVDRGDPLGEMNLALLYEEDEGRTEEAFKLYRKGADRNDAEAMIKLYFCYWNGNGVSSDHPEALKWLTKAAERGNAYAQSLLGYRYESREWVGAGPERKLTDENFVEAARWYRRSADQNWAGGQYQLGLLYLRGDGVELNEEEAIRLLQKAADQNHSDALYKLAWLYARDIGAPRNEGDRPFDLLLRAAANNSRESFWALSQRYEEGLGTSRDLVEAAAWRYRAAAADMMKWAHNDSLIASAFDESKAKDTFATTLVLVGKAAQNDASAMRQIAAMYQEGKSVPVNPVRARFWSTLADRRGASGDFPPEWTTHWSAAAKAARMILSDLGRRE